jgi:glycosyltransferase involved in cell wall biosynthesis
LDPDHQASGESRSTIFFKEWLALNGIGQDKVADLGDQPQDVIAKVLERVDLGVFPSRVEGGTNLVAMEAMAAGVPLVISNSTGHIDIVGSGEHCYPVEAAGAEATASKFAELMKEANENREAAREKVGDELDEQAGHIKDISFI